MAVTEEKRREARYPARIVARIWRRSQMAEHLTNDVSYRGVFLRADAMPALRQLVKVELVLPNQQVVSGHAMVVHLSERPPGEEKGTGAVPGMGLQFWGPIENQREWDQFIHGLRVREKAGLAAAKATDKVRRASERFRLSIEVDFDGKRSMTRDLSSNGMAIRTDLAMPVGTRTLLTMRAGDDEVFFDAIVRRAISETGFRGLGVEFVSLTDDKRATLSRFLTAHAPEETPVFVPPNDPKLH